MENPILPTAPPPQLPPHLRWRRVKVPPGINAGYMKAGPGWFGTCHFNGQVTKPCCAVLTDGQVECPWCKWTKRFTCYLPVFATSHTKQDRLVVQGAKRSWETWQELKFGALVNVVRGKGSRDTVLFTPAARGAITCDLSKLTCRGEQNIGGYLLHLWQWRPLTEFFKTDFIPSIATEEKARPSWVMKDGGAEPI